MKLCILFVVLAFVEATNLNQHSNDATDGYSTTDVYSDISITQMPWMVSVQDPSHHICSGIIISNDWVLTAAICVRGQTGYSYKIRSGSLYYNSGGSLHNSQEVIIHEDYDSSKYGFVKNNIALIRINGTFEFDSTRRAASLGEINRQSLYGNAHGWGQNKALQETSVSIILEESKCDQKSPYNEGIYDGQFCFDFQESTSIKSTDFGSPVSNEYREIVGIIAWNNPKYPEFQDIPTIVTSISAYRLWIKHYSGV